MIYLILFRAAATARKKGFIGILAPTVASLMVLFSISTAAHAQITTGTTAAGLIYSADPTSVTITGYTGSNATLNIPSTINSLPVTEINSKVFSQGVGLSSVTVSSSVMGINVDAFSNCTSLTSIVVDGANASYSSTNGVLFNKAQTTLINILEQKSAVMLSRPALPPSLPMHSPAAQT